MKLVDFVICDDVRRELANKLTIVGTYNDQIQFETKSVSEMVLPMNIRLGLYVRIDIENSAEVQFVDVVIKGVPVTEEVKGVFTLGSIDRRRILVLATPFVMGIKEQGMLDIEIICKDGEQKELARLKPYSSLSIIFKELK